MSRYFVNPLTLVYAESCLTITPFHVTLEDVSTPLRSGPHLRPPTYPGQRRLFSVAVRDALSRSPHTVLRKESDLEGFAEESRGTELVLRRPSALPGGLLPLPVPFACRSSRALSFGRRIAQRMVAPIPRLLSPCWCRFLVKNT